MSLLEVAAQIFVRRCDVAQIGFIQQNDREQSLRCVHCRRALYFDRRDWEDPHRKLEQKESFRAQHEDCNLLAQLEIERTMKIRMFARPLRRFIGDA